MKASIVDLRYKMNEVIKALERNETVTVLYHGKEKGVITPVKRDLKMGGNQKAAKLVEEAQERFLSIQTYMELLQCAKNIHCYT